MSNIVTRDEASTSKSLEQRNDASASVQEIKMGSVMFDAINFLIESSSESEDEQEIIILEMLRNNDEIYPYDILLKNERIPRNSIKHYFHKMVPDYTDVEFRTHFRISRALYENLSKRFLDSDIYKALRPDKQLPERRPEALQNNKTVTECKRYSLDIDEDLKNIIEEKKNQKKNITKNCVVPKNKNQFLALHTEPEVNYRMNRLAINNEENVCEKSKKGQNTPDESFEALEKMCEKTLSDPNSTLYKYLNGEEEQKTNNILLCQQTSDESFEALEKMCDKTASDPNSTLFQYLHSERKDRVLADFKKRNAGGNINYISEKEDNLFIKFNNCTLLDDVEAPSRIWENTICDDTAIQTSPIKMVGLLRPSTIIEEAPDETCNSDMSSQLSFKTATKTVQNDVSSSTYDTAYDSTAPSSHFSISNRDRKQELDVIDVDHILLSAIEKSKEQRKNSENIILEDTVTEAVSSDSDSNKNYILHTADFSLNLIDLEKTFEPLPNLQGSSLLKDFINDKEDTKQNSPVEKISEVSENKSHSLFDDSVIEILSDDDIEEGESRNNITSAEKGISCIKLEVNSNCSYSSNKEVFNLNESLKDNKKNEIALPESLEKSMQFNDTMEEVEYMLKKGMEYMAAEAALKQNFKEDNAPLPLLTENTFKTQHISPVAHKKLLKNASTFKAKPCTYATSAKKATPANKGQNYASNRFDIDIRPFPKLDLFSKPMHVRHKELTTRQQKFSHIVSPIGTYMKKTAKTPLMSSINSKNAYFNSTSIQELENESRLYQPLSTTNGGKSKGLPGVMSELKRPLPKKAYISSDLKHIVDERTPVTIPGGSKIQKYLENAIMPAVLRHDGKLKIPGTCLNNKLTMSTTTSATTPTKQPLKNSDTNSTATTKSSQISHCNNASLADLSLMSGDVSMYTIMDAQKF